MPNNPTVNKYRLLEKLKNAGYADEKSILNMDISIIGVKTITRVELEYVLEIREAVRQKRIIEYLASPHLKLDSPKGSDKNGT
ncbi:MAG: hypothetical protein IJJ41_01350 [Clostridia bacterium]|nr:hypothetical protein [Clostridia bacterium]MBR0413724.1 hypothetical protein [Clostridia bacterium]